MTMRAEHRGTVPGRVFRIRSGFLAGGFSPGAVAQALQALARGERVDGDEAAAVDDHSALLLVEFPGSFFPAHVRGSVVVVGMNDAEVFIEVLHHLVQFLDFAIEFVQAFPFGVGQALDGAV